MSILNRLKGKDHTRAIEALRAAGILQPVDTQGHFVEFTDGVFVGPFKSQDHARTWNLETQTDVLGQYCGVIEGRLKEPGLSDAFRIDPQRHSALEEFVREIQEKAQSIETAPLVSANRKIYDFVQLAKAGPAVPRGGNGDE